MTELTKVEYRIRKVERFVVTRYEQGERSSGSETKGEFDSEILAFEIACSLAGAEHQKLGWPEGDERMKYPELSAPSA